MAALSYHKADVLASQGSYVCLTYYLDVPRISSYQGSVSCSQWTVEFGGGGRGGGGGGRSGILAWLNRGSAVSSILPPRTRARLQEIIQ